MTLKILNAKIIFDNLSGPCAITAVLTRGRPRGEGQGGHEMVGAEIRQHPDTGEGKGRILHQSPGEKCGSANALS